MLLAPSWRIGVRTRTTASGRSIEGNAQPTAAYTLRGNDVVGHADATKAMRSHCGSTTFGIRMATRSPQRRARCRETTFCGIGMRQGNTQPTAARALQRDDILRHSNATKAMRSPQRHTHCRATTLLDPCLPVLVSFYGVNWLSTLNVIGWQYVKCHNMLLHKKMKSQLLLDTSWSGVAARFFVM